MNPTPPAESAEEALQRASTHARNALAEAISAGRALLDAGSLIASDIPALANGRLTSLAHILDDLANRLSTDRTTTAPASAPLLQAFADALEAEIARWECRAARDRDARAVLRAFLGIREILWELGIRPSPQPQSAAEDPHRATPFEQRDTTTRTARTELDANTSFD